MGQIQRSQRRRVAFYAEARPTANQISSWAEEGLRSGQVSGYGQGLPHLR